MEKVVAEYAVKSKRPGDVRDYHIMVSGCKQLSEGDFEEIFKRSSVGTMPLPAYSQNSDNRPPWFTFGSYLKAKSDLYVTAVRQEWTDQQDGRGDRRIAALSCLCVPYDALARVSASYLNIGISVPGYQTLLQGTTPFELTLKMAGEWERDIVPQIEKTGYDFMAATAALLLDGPVVLMKGGALSVKDRLLCLEAIVSLLPYGSRANLQLSTWMESASPHNIQLGFSDSARAYQRRVVWGKAPVEALKQGTPAYEYYSSLQSLKDHTQGGVPTIVAALAQRKDPLSFEAPQRYVQALHDLDRPFLTFQAVHQKHYTVQDAEVRRLFTEGNVGSLDPTQRKELLLHLLRRSGRENLQVVEMYWPVGNQDELRQALCAVARESMARPGSKLEALQLLVNLASSKNLFKDYAAFLIEESKSPSGLPPRQEVIKDIVQLLLHADNAYAVQNHETIAEAAWGHPALVLELIEQSWKENPDSLDTWLRWLDDGAPQMEEVELFQLARGLTKTEAQGITFGELEANHVYTLFEVACESKTGLDQLAPAFITWLMVNRARLRNKGDWQQTLSKLARDRDITLSKKAQVELLSWAIEPATALSATSNNLSSPEFKQYTEAIVHTIGKLGDSNEQIALGFAERFSGTMMFHPNKRDAETVLSALYKLYAYCTSLNGQRRIRDMVLQIAEECQVVDERFFIDIWGVELNKSQENKAKLGFSHVKSALRAGRVQDAANKCVQLLHREPEMLPLVVGELFDLRNRIGSGIEITRFVRELCDALKRLEIPESFESKFYKAVLGGNKEGAPISVALLDYLIEQVESGLKKVQQDSQNLIGWADHSGIADEIALMAEQVTKARRFVDSPEGGLKNLFGSFRRPTRVRASKQSESTGSRRSPPRYLFPQIANNTDTLKAINSVIELLAPWLQREKSNELGAILRQIESNIGVNSRR